MNKLLAFHLAAVNSDIFPANSTGAHGLKFLLISFLIMCVVLGIIAAALYIIDRYIHVLPDPVRLVTAIVCVILVLIWACTVFF